MVKVNVLMRTTSQLTTALAVILSLIFPVGYFVLAYEFNRTEVEIEGRLEVIDIQKFIDRNPDSWHREPSQLKELLGEMSEESHDHFLVNHDNLLRIENVQGNVIAQNHENHHPLPLYFDYSITRSINLLSNGTVVGKFIISRELDNLILNTVLSGLLGIIFGGMALFVMREYPLWALRRAIEKLEDEKERAEVTLHCIGDAVMTTNANGLIEYLNPVAEQMLGWNSAEVSGLPLIEVFKQVDEKSGEPLPDPVRQVIQENPSIPLVRYALLTKSNGQQIPIKSSVMPIRNMAGEVIGVVLGLHDVTQDQALGAAEEANRIKGEFLANISHEIRTPLNGVLGMLQLMSLTELNAEQREYIGVAHRSGESLMTLLNDLLDFSKIEAGRLELESIEFDPRQLVEDVVALQASLVRDKDLLNVMCLIGASVPERLRGDPTRLRQVLVNLVSNAIKFTKHGEVLVQVGLLVEAGSVLYEHHADVDSYKEGCTLHFSVSDTGIGVAQSQLKNIFEPFTQGDSSITRKHGGTGLGLAICQRLVHAMGGTIGVTGRANGGSVFSFVVQMQAAKLHPDEMWRPHPELAGKRILIIEDNGSNRMLLEHYFSSWGMRHTSIMGDVHAVELCLHEASVVQDLFDVVVLGSQIFMHMAGQEIIRRIYGDPVQRNVKLIALRPVVVGGVNRRRSEVSVDEAPADSAADMTVATAKIRQAEIADYVPHAYIPSLVRMHELHDVLVEVLQLLPTQVHLPPLPGLQAVVEHTIPSHTKVALNNEVGLVHQLSPEIVSAEQKTISAIGKILVVEDDKVSQLIVAGMLSKMGFSADVAGDGVQALAVCKLQFYDLVLMDMMMPVMGGAELARQIRAMEATSAGELNATGNTIHKPTIIIAVTANASDSDRLNCLEAGMNDVIPKPVQFDLLKEMLTRWLVNFPEHSPLSAVHSTVSVTPYQSQQSGSVVMNRNELVKLRELLAENFENTVRVFIEDTARRVAVLHDAVTRDDRDGMMRQAHTLKGSCSNFGALELTALCELLQQQLLAAEAAADIKHTLEHIVQAFVRVKIELEEMLCATPNIGLNRPVLI